MLSKTKIRMMVDLSTETIGARKNTVSLEFYT